jgi:hypothetical protein
MLLLSALMLTVVVLATSLTGCWLFKPAQPKEGIEKGFSYGTALGGYIAAAAKSEKNEFNIDDVTLDFYYGHYNGLATPTDKSRYEEICVAVYFSLSENTYSSFDDYRDIEDFYFVKEIPIEEFIANYTVTSKAGLLGGRRTFSRSEQFTLPLSFINDCLENTRKTATPVFNFYVGAVIYDRQENQYRFVQQKQGTYDSALISFKLKSLDENTVYLS